MVNPQPTREPPGSLPDERVCAYFGDDGSLYPVRSALSHVARSSVPRMTAVAGFEDRYLDDYGAPRVDRAEHVPPCQPASLGSDGHVFQLSVHVGADS
jgi:hypothetical protein